MNLRPTLHAIYRLAVLAALLPAWFLVLLLTAWLPDSFRIQGIRPAAWTITGLARMLLHLYRIQVSCWQPARLVQHAGFVFANHLSFLDVVVLLSLLPMRFLSMAEVREQKPLGWMAEQIGTIFVDRGDPESRRQARLALAAQIQAAPYPPLVIFPEGKLGAGGQLLPFHTGAFAVAVDRRIPLLPCTIHYDRHDVATWRVYPGETVRHAVWRMLRYAGPVRVQLLPLSLCRPQGSEEPQQLAEDTRQAMAQALGWIGPGDPPPGVPPSDSGTASPHPGCG